MGSPLSSSQCFSVQIPMITIESARLLRAGASLPAYLVADTIIYIFSSYLRSAAGAYIASFQLALSLAASISFAQRSLMTKLLPLQSFRTAYPPGQFESLLQQDRKLMSLILTQILTSRKVPESLQTKQNELFGILVKAENSSLVYCRLPAFLTFNCLQNYTTFVKQQTCNSQFLFLMSVEKQRGMASSMSSEKLLPCLSH